MSPWFQGCRNTYNTHRSTRNPIPLRQFLHIDLNCSLCMRASQRQLRAAPKRRVAPRAVHPQLLEIGGTSSSFLEFEHADAGRLRQRGSFRNNALRMTLHSPHFKSRFGPIASISAQLVAIATDATKPAWAHCSATSRDTAILLTPSPFQVQL